MRCTARGFGVTILGLVLAVAAGMMWWLASERAAPGAAEIEDHAPARPQEAAPLASAAAVEPAPAAREEHVAAPSERETVEPSVAAQHYGYCQHSPARFPQ